MRQSANRIAEVLEHSNIRPTYPRIKVLAYLMTAQSHPTVDEIYNNLITEIPSLSKMTIYNTLKLFVDANLVKLVNIEENEMRYDIIMTRHGHFKCETCGKIYDFAVDVDAVEVEGLDKFKITQKDVLFRGVCPQCLNSEEEGG
ncbi:MAG TPA: Fur family transcriptional regulator [Methylomusa anaerophila]|uniref:Peroxide operon regulator n=1 Tax=Methylomusa anaerophila TaxID=1930071 RepID=A0A348AJ45_9FIRM|nr:Fur family transcriptional regulator [Methylomusa anaerophila]BBB91093.1 peroxide operon regulator [Methylomusa anaerophila]HML88970.1 Fur family transcriptional regulator [Methylomusa anaerophila]